MKHQRAYRYRCYPTSSQRQTLARTFGCARFVFNWDLRLRSEAYRQRGEHLFYRDTSAALSRLKQDSDYAWLNVVSGVPPQQALRHLDQAFRNFFDGQPQVSPVQEEAWSPVGRVHAPLPSNGMAAP